MPEGVETQLSERAMRGVDTLLSGYTRLRPTDGVVVCFPKACLEGASWIAAAVKARKLPFRTCFFAHNDDARFERDVDALIRELRDEPHVERAVIILCEHDSLRFSGPLRRRLLADRERVEVVRVTNCIPDLFEMAFDVTPEVQRQINAGLLESLMNAKRLRVRSASGTDMSIVLDSSVYSWVSSYGVAGPSEINNLPCGEISTYPVTVDGRFVVDGGLNSNFVLPFDARLKRNPIVLEIAHGEITTFHCEHPDIMKFLEWNFSKPFARHVGELGIGTNVGIDKFVALSSHINERHPGIHLGFGEHNQPGLVDYEAEVHLDAIIADAMIEIDDRITLDTRCFKPSAVAHPLNLRTEDAEALPQPLAAGVWTKPKHTESRAR